MPVILRIALLCVVIPAAIYDLRFRRIPNWISLSGIVLGFGCYTLLSGLHGFSEAGLGLLCALAVYFPLYLVRGMGAGDVKLMAAVGAMSGPSNWLWIFLATALIGGLISLSLVASKRRFRQTLGNVGLIASELLHLRAPAETDARLDYRHAEAMRLPHGAAIACGSIVFLFLSVFRQV